MTHFYAPFSCWLRAALLLVLLLAAARFSVRAQSVGIGTPTPNASAALDVVATNKGLLVPRVALSGAAAAAPLTAPATGLLVYNTNDALPGGVGFYHNAGTPAAPQWVRLVTTASPAGGDQWRTGGNDGTTAGTQFIGTTDAQDVVFKANGSERLRLKSSNGALWTGMANSNVALGANTGAALTTGRNNVLLGQDAGAALTFGSLNTFTGHGSGQNTTGGENTFAGAFSGLRNTTGSGNTYAGASSGTFNTTGSDNTLLGRESGRQNASGSRNTLLGTFSGFNNRADENVFVGYSSGQANTTGTLNTFVGSLSGLNNGTGDRNTALGQNAGPSVGTLTNTTAIGNEASVSASNSLVLGGTGANAVNVGIGMSAPQTALDVLGGLTLRDDGTVTSLTVDNQVIQVGNRSYIRLSSNTITAANRVVDLSNGLVRGQLLIIQSTSTGGNGFQIGDVAGTNVDTAGTRTLGAGDTIMLLWTGSLWSEISYTDS